MKNISNNDFTARILGIKLEDFIHKDCNEVSKKSINRFFQKKEIKWHLSIPKIFLSRIEKTFSELNKKHSEIHEINILRDFLIKTRDFPAIKDLYRKVESPSKVENSNPFRTLLKPSIMDDYYNEILNKGLIPNIVISENEQYIKDILLCILYLTALHNYYKGPSFIGVFPLIDKSEKWSSPVRYFLTQCEKKSDIKLEDYVIPIRNRDEKKAEFSSHSDFIKQLKSERQFKLGSEQTMKYIMLCENIIFRKKADPIYITAFLEPYLYTRFILIQRDLGNENYMNIMDDFKKCEEYFLNIS